MAGKRKKADDSTLFLPLSISGQEEVQYRGVFSGPYIKTHFRRRPEYPAKDLVDGLYQQAKKLWTDNYAALKKRDEAFTRAQFIDPILRLLGWHSSMTCARWFSFCLPQLKNPN